MFLKLRKIIFTLTYNSCLFLLLIIGIQNSSNSSRVKLLKNQTIKLPISFIIGSSFIGGSLIGSLFTINTIKNIKS